LRGAAVVKSDEEKMAALGRLAMERSDANREDALLANEIAGSDERGRETTG
jgi:hypothetical protein